MASREDWDGERMARFYGPEVCKLSRPERIAFVQAKIAEEEARWTAVEAAHDAAHLAGCVKCQSGDRCFSSRFEVTPGWDEHRKKMNFRRRLIRLEEDDEEYAQRSRFVAPEYRNHIDGFCAYWQNVRHRLFEVAGNKCEKCDEPGNLEAHHRRHNYDTLGFEEVGDCRRFAGSVTRSSGGEDTKHRAGTERRSISERKTTT